jgi:thioredoxin reductase (NADPH)
MAPLPVVPIIGGGPAGMSCALWLHNYGLDPVIIERENVLGGMAQRDPFPNEGLLGRRAETGRESAAAFAAHIGQLNIRTWEGAAPVAVQRTAAEDFGLEIRLSTASSRSLLSKVLVIATGTRFAGEEWLARVRNAREWAERGRVHLGAPWAGEADSDLGSHVAVIGGGDNAFDVARMLVEKGVRATIVMRSQAPRARASMVERLRMHERSGRARVIAGRTVEALTDARGELGLCLDDGSELNSDHVLLLFGYRPNSDENWIAALALAMDPRGYLTAQENMETSCRGIFAIGDVANPLHPSIPTALGSATKAAREIARRLQQA